MKNLSLPLIALCLLTSNLAYSFKLASPETFRNSFRNIMEDHMKWKRNLVYNIITNSSGLNSVKKNYEQNISCINETFSVYYGEEKSYELFMLLSENYFITTKIVYSLSSNDGSSFDKLYCEWIKNTDAMAQHMSLLNKYLSYSELQQYWYLHLELISDMARKRMEGHFEEANRIFENSKKQILDLADYISNGIIRQFPEKFAGQPIVGK